MIGQTNAVEEINGRYPQLANCTMLYDNGDECTKLTGGYGMYNHSNGWEVIE